MPDLTATPPTLSLMDERGSPAKTWALAGKTSFRIGRGKGNDIELDNHLVSRQHLILQVEENGRVNAVDLGSANGTTVNGLRLYAPTPLRSGDRLRVGGQAELVFLQEAPAASLVTGELEDEQTVAFLTTGQVTVLVCDIRRFTSLSERLGPGQVSDIVKSWSQQANALVLRHQGRIDKFIGDAAMAVWAGGGISPSQSVPLALTCAVKIAEMTGKLSQSLRPPLPWPLAIRAAINTGEAVLGNVGVDGNRDYSVIGDAVNVAFRLGLDILIGDQAAGFLDPGLVAACLSPCQCQLKGKSQPVSARGGMFVDLDRHLASGLA